MEIIVDIFKSLAEESRLPILSLLVQEEMCVCEIEDCLKMTQSNVFRHLAALKQSRILDSCKKAQWVYYKIGETFIKENSLLWEYLVDHFQKDPIYRTEIRARRTCE